MGRPSLTSKEKVLYRLSCLSTFTLIGLRNVDSVEVSVYNRWAENKPCFPTVSEEDIANQSQSDPFTKAFAILQCLWMIIQSITRAFQGLPMTELELTTLAFIACAVFMYAFWWYKPFDSRRPIYLLCRDPQIATQIRESLGRWDENVRNRHPEGIIFSGIVGLVSSRKQASLISVLFHMTALAFSGIHLAAWDWEFPSGTVQTLWRIFAVITTCAPLTILLMRVIYMAIYAFMGTTETAKTMMGVVMLPTGPILIIYMVSRVGLIVLIFYCFSAMPASVYESPDWNIVLPHFS